MEFQAPDFSEQSIDCHSESQELPNENSQFTQEQQIQQQKKPTKKIRIIDALCKIFSEISENFENCKGIIHKMIIDGEVQDYRKSGKKNTGNEGIFKQIFSKALLKKSNEGQQQQKQERTPKQQYLNALHQLIEENFYAHFEFYNSQLLQQGFKLQSDRTVKRDIQKIKQSQKESQQSSEEYSQQAIKQATNRAKKITDEQQQLIEESLHAQIVKNEGYKLKRPQVFATICQITNTNQMSTNNKLAYNYFRKFYSTKTELFKNNIQENVNISESESEPESEQQQQLLIEEETEEYIEQSQQNFCKNHQTLQQQQKFEKEEETSLFFESNSNNTNNYFIHEDEYQFDNNNNNNNNDDQSQNFDFNYENEYADVLFNPDQQVIINNNQTFNYFSNSQQY